jgi:hypothetical protein
MGDPYAKLPAGSAVTKFSVTAWNRMLDMLRWWLSQQAKSGSSGVSADTDVCIFDVKNDSGEDQDWLAPLGLDDIVITPDDNLDGFRHKPMLSGITPVIPDHRGKWAILLSPCPDGDIVKAAVSGVVPTRVYVNDFNDKACDVIEKKTVEGDSEADPPTEDEDCYLGSGSSGAQIIWWEASKESDNETIVWALVRLGSNGDDCVRIRLKGDLYPCDEADGVILTTSSGSGSGSNACSDCGDEVCTESDDVKVSDTIGVVAVLFKDEGYAPAGSVCYARKFPDTGKYEAISFGDGLCCESSSSSSPSSGSPSSSSASSSSPSGSASPSESSTSKSTAIVPASWSPTGYTALFVEESPEVRFDDIVTGTLTAAETYLPIDVRFIEVCEPGSLQVCGCVPDVPVLIGATVEGQAIRVRTVDASGPVRVVIRLTGIRKGFRGLRFPDRTRKQFEANERRLQQGRSYV